MKNGLLLLLVALNSCSASLNAQKTSEAGIPVCIKQLIKKFKSEEKKNPPRSIYSYSFKGKKVYYVTAICCDQYSDLYDESCNIIGHPDGGLTGKGDGQARNFDSEKTEERLLWKDER